MPFSDVGGLQLGEVCHCQIDQAGSVNVNKSL